LSPTPAKEAEKSKEKDGKDEPKQKAKVFYVAYTRTEVGDDPAKRPITFSFNGGPGSASVWLHLGALGPRRTELTERGEAPLAPYHLVDNEATWLDTTDLVFIDPVSTGYSRSAPGEDPKQFHGFKEDLASVGDFIRLYTSRNTRWASPKFIIGESYGTTRAAGLSDYLQERYGFYVNGIILVSSVLDFSSIRFAPGNDRPYALFLPTYTAAAWYHKKLPPDLQSKPLKDVLREISHPTNTCSRSIAGIGSRKINAKDFGAISHGSPAYRQIRSRNGISGFPRGAFSSICSRIKTAPSAATMHVSPAFVMSRARRSTISIRATKPSWGRTAR
jgi:carboxypeptidase C (cathepsin A)